MLVAMTLGALACCAWASAEPVSAVGPPELIALDPGEVEITVHTDPTIVRSRRVQIDRSVLEARDLGNGSEVRVTFFDDVSFTIVFRDVYTRSPTSYTWYGDTVEVPGWFILSVENDVVLANIWAPGTGVYRLRLLPDGGSIVHELDMDQFPSCGVQGVEGAQAEGEDPGLAPNHLCEDDGSVIDMLVVYTEDARIGAGGTAAMVALIGMMETATNVGYLNSEITTTVRIVGMEEVEYTESGDSTTDLARLVDPNDGFLDDVPVLRDDLAADVASLIVESLTDGFCGRARFSIGTGNVPFPEIAFNVNRRDCAVDNLTFPHELGHNQGSRHDRASDNSDGAFDYSHGYVEPGGTFRTIMALNPNGVPRIQWFSNPDVLFNGLPTGVPIDETNSAHNAMSINLTAFNVANFRCSQFLPDLDIKPGSCPNSFNRRSRGVLPVGLLGTEDFDITQIDVASIWIARADGVGGSVAPHEGPPGPHSEFADVGTPFVGVTCECHEEKGDGILDLSMHFKTQLVVEVLELDDLPAGDLVELMVSGMLLDGTPFEVFDCIRLVPPGTGGAMLVVGAEGVTDAYVGVHPLDLQLDGGGFTRFERTFPVGTVVMLTAEPRHNNSPFVAWRLDGHLVSDDLTLVFVVTRDNHTVEALYDGPSKMLR